MEVTDEPLALIAADDPVTCAIYAKDNGLLDEPSWKRFKKIAKHQKTFTRMANQAKLRSYRSAPRYKYGFEVPRDYGHALRRSLKSHLQTRYDRGCRPGASALPMPVSVAMVRVSGCGSERRGFNSPRPP